MFAKSSRYRKVPDVVALDARGRLVAAKDIRLAAPVAGTFRHTLNAGDRLDQLAHKYYGQPLQWWRICDANPEFLSPLALIGQEVIATTTFPVTAAGEPPPWAALLAALAAVVGVEDVQPLEAADLFPKQQIVDGKEVTVVDERFARAVRVRYNRLVVTAETLAGCIAAAGFTLGTPEHAGRVGQEMIIPPRPVG